jgi:hypothetical protein
VSLVNVNANGAVTGATSIASAATLDFSGTNSIKASAGIYAKGARYGFNERRGKDPWALTHTNMGFA